MFSRPIDSGPTPFGDIYLSRSPDLIHWGRHPFVMGVLGGWESTKVGAGYIPIETTEDWLMFYHGVLTSCNRFVYSFTAFLLDLDQPWKVIYLCISYLLSLQRLLRVC
jgi:beta-1,4-mannooligosaccharide/beta-1,4-mannosyl-N-acetylglucosamine phosphorylase